MPGRFLNLKPAQQDGALATLQQVEFTLRQSVLDEWDVRCRSNTVRNPAGYLFGMIQKAIRGEFNAWAAKAGPESAPAPSVPASNPKLFSEVAKQHLAQIREFLGKE